MISPKNRKVLAASGILAALLISSASAGIFSQPQTMPAGWDVADEKTFSDRVWGGTVHKVQQQGQQQVQQQRVQLRIINTLPVPVDYYVVNPNTGQPQRVNTLQPSGVADLGSQPGLGWIFVQNQQQIQSYQTRSEAFQELRIAAPGQQQPPRLANQFQPPANSQNAQQQGQQQTGQPQALGRQQTQLQQGQQQLLGQQSGQVQSQQQTFGQRPLGQQGGQPLGQQYGQQQGQLSGQQGQLQQGQLQTLGQRPTGQLQGQQQGQRPIGQQSAQPLGQEPRLPEPPGLYQSSLTVEDCMKSYFTPGSPQIRICGYISQLSRLDPGAYQNYLASAQLRNNQSGGIQGQQQQQGFGSTNQGFGNASGGFPAASSWGGIVRSAPSMQSDRLDSLSEGEVITLLADTGVDMNGYNWFQIQYRNGQTGYQWGGIICGQTQPIPGTFEICN